jgi:putative ABC transport system permease protein
MLLRVSDILLISGKSIWERKTRFVLNLIGVLIGCMAITGLISLTQGLNGLVGDQLESFGPRTIMIFPGELGIQSVIGSRSFNWRDLQTVQRIANLEILTPLCFGEMAKIEKQNQVQYVFLMGQEAEYFDIMSGWTVIEGRTLLRGDTGVVVLGYDIALPSDSNIAGYRIGERIDFQVMVEGEIKSKKFRVVGIMEEFGGLAGQSSDEDQTVYMPMKDYQQFLETEGEYQYFVSCVADINDLPKVEIDIKEAFNNDVTVMTSESSAELFDTILGAVEGLLGGVAAISLVVAGVGIINTMTISVLERTKEIGILKALGGKSLDVLAIFLCEAVLTGFIGGSLGSGLGLLIGNVMGGYMDMPVSSDPVLVMGVIVFAIATTVLSGIYPAWRASGLHPVDALRQE